MDRVVVRDGSVVLHAGGHTVAASRVVMCTNGFVDHVVEDQAGERIKLHPDQRVTGVIGFVAAFAEEQRRSPAAMSHIRNTTIGGDTPYVYVTRRTYDRASGTVTLTCAGRPRTSDRPPWDPAMPFPGSLLSYMDAHIRPFAQPARPPGRPYEFRWHGLMGYMQGWSG